MDIDWRYFTVGADRDGEMEINHDEGSCHWGECLIDTRMTIAELMKLVEEHLKTCPIWTGDES